MLIRTVDRFSMSLSPSASDSPGTLEVKFKVPVQRPNHFGSPPSCRETLTISSNFLLSRIDQRVSTKNGGTSTGKTPEATPLRLFFMILIPNTCYNLWFFSSSSFYSLSSSILDTRTDGRNHLRNWEGTGRKGRDGRDTELQRSSQFGRTKK